MNPNRSSPPDGLRPGAEDDSEVMRILDAYLSAIEAGEPADPDKLLADHPALAGPLRAYLEVMHVAGRLAEGSHVRPKVTPADPSSDDLTSPPGSSLLTTLDFGPGPPPHIHLLELLDEREPLVMPRSAEMPHPGGAGLGRYQLQGEIARGGMGAILRGRDVDLGRDLAIKVLLESHNGNTEVVRRFVEEAQIGGQLQHPGVVPVYELGTFPDRRPFFAMKLVKGRTLAALLAERADRVGRGSPSTRRVAALDRAGRGSPDPALDRAGRGSPDPALPGTEGLPSAHDDLPRFLGIFEQVCQTMAYAHARGVIHRDLKPSNVMVGSFGEVQVMDWGLAKVLPSGGIADEDGAQPAHETVIMTVRSGSAGSGSESQAGSVLGTPAYMAPEQARGEVDRLDERSDVFGLGAILCEILTGRPPFAGSTREEIRAQAARGDLADALGRLEQCDADAELVELARSCLRSDRDRRPRNAGEVVGRMTAYRVGAQERLKAAELGRVEAQTRAEEAGARAVIERSRRRRTVALAASVLITAAVIGGGWTYLAQQRTARLMATNRVVTEALAEAERLRGQAQAAELGDLSKWSEAMGAARRARDLLAQGEADNALRGRVAAVLAELEQEQDAAAKRVAEVERDRKLLSRLETILGNLADHYNAEQTHVEFAAAFREFGIDLDRLDPKEAGKRIAQRSAPLELASHLDHWAVMLRGTRDKKDEASWRRLLTAAQATDPDPWRVALRDQIFRNDRQALMRLAADPKTLETQPARTLLLLAVALQDQGNRDQAEQVLRRAWRLEPGDFWIDLMLGQVFWAEDHYVRPDEAARFLSAAVAVRPRSDLAHEWLGRALGGSGKLEEAIAEFRTAVRLRPDSDAAHESLGSFLRDHGKLEEAIAEFRTALRLRPDSDRHHNRIGYALREQGKLDEAITEYREALRLMQDSWWHHQGLGDTLKAQGKPEQAIAEYRESLRLKPDSADTHNKLGASLCDDKHDYDGAIREFRTALRLNPGYVGTQTNLGIALSHQGKLSEGIAAFREALRLNPNYPDAHDNLGNALREQGKLEESIAEFREALRLKPDYHAAHNNLGLALVDQGKLEEAIAEYRTALRLKSDLPEPHFNLGRVFRQQGRFVDALAEVKRGHELGSKKPNWHNPSAEWVREAERLVELDRKLPAILAGKTSPLDALETMGFAWLCYYKMLHGASARLWAEAFQAQPKLAEDMQAQNRYNAACAAALAGSGQGKDDPPLDDAAKARWRKQAVDWLKADLAAWSKLLGSGPPQARQSIPQTLQHWKADADLAGLRDQAALAKLPADEQKACRAVWAEVDALLAKSQGTKPEQGH